MNHIPQVTVREADGCAVVTPFGDIFFDTYEPLQATLMRLATGPRPRIVLDLGQVAVCDSTGLHLMTQVHRQAAGSGGWLRLAACRPMVWRVLQITNLTHLLPVYPTLDDAVADGSR